MALMIDLAKDPNPNPKNYGLIDFYHNQDGQVDYTYFYDSNHPHENTGEKPEPRCKQRYTDICSDSALDNFNWEREKHAARCTGFKEYERWLECWN